MPRYKFKLPNVLPGHPDYSSKVIEREGKITASTKNHAFTMALKRGNNDGIYYYYTLLDLAEEEGFNNGVDKYIEEVDAESRGERAETLRDMGPEVSMEGMRHYVISEIANRRGGIAQGWDEAEREVDEMPDEQVRGAFYRMRQKRGKKKEP